MDSKEQSKRRLKICIIDQTEIIEILRTGVGDDVLTAENLVIPHLTDIPKDAEIISCSYDYACLGFAFMFRHESFPIVPKGAIIPVVSCRKVLYKKSNYKVSDKFYKS
jgi:hypothetical protein